MNKNENQKKKPEDPLKKFFNRVDRVKSGFFHVLERSEEPKLVCMTAILDFFFEYFKDEDEEEMISILQGLIARWDAPSC